MPLPSRRKIVANRHNCLKSTGPKSKQGKDKSSQNAFKYGIRADELYSDEDKEEFTAFADALIAELQPVGVLEEVLVNSVISHSWRIHRVRRVEFTRQAKSRSEIVIVRLYLPDNGRGLPPSEEPPQPDAATVNFDAKEFMHLSRYEGARERGLYRALANLEQLQTARKKKNKNSKTNPPGT